MSVAEVLEGACVSPRIGEGGRALASLGAVLDAALPWNGLPAGALHEVSGIAATSAVAAMARRALRNGGSLVWCRDRRLAGELGALDAACLTRFGLAAARVTIIPAADEAEVACAFEAALRSPGVACAVAEVGTLRLPIGRRLRRAAAAGVGIGLLLRPEFDPSPNAALTRWRAEPARSTGGVAWRLTLWRAERAPPRTFTVRWDERTLCFVPFPLPG